MVTKLIQIVAGVAIAGGIISYNAKDRANTFEAYGLSGPTLEMAQTCDSSMSRYNLEFKQGAKNHAGCACLAREISTNIETPDYEFLKTSYSSILKARATNDDAAISEVITGALLSGDTDKAGQLMQMMGYMSTCSDRSSEKEIRQSYIAENMETEIEAGSLEASDDTTSTRTGLRSDIPKKPTGKCAKLTDEQIAQREEGAKEAGLRFDRATCKMYSL